MCLYVHMHAGGYTLGPERMSDPLQLALQVPVSRLAWLLGTPLGSSETATSTFNHRTISPVSGVTFKLSVNDLGDSLCF